MSTLNQMKLMVKLRLKIKLIKDKEERRDQEH